MRDVMVCSQSYSFLLDNYRGSSDSTFLFNELVESSEINEPFSNLIEQGYWTKSWPLLLEPQESLLDLFSDSMQYCLLQQLIEMSITGKMTISYPNMLLMHTKGEKRNSAS